MIFRSYLVASRLHCFSLMKLAQVVRNYRARWPVAATGNCHPGQAGYGPSPVGSSRSWSKTSASNVCRRAREVNLADFASDEAELPGNLGPVGSNSWSQRGALLDVIPGVSSESVRASDDLDHKSTTTPEARFPL